MAVLESRACATAWLAVISMIPGALAQTSDVPYAPFSDAPGPTFKSKAVLVTYPGRFSSLRAIDFRNFRFLDSDDAGKISAGLALKNGHFRSNDRFDHYSVDLDSVYYLPGSAVSGGSALVVLSWFEAAGSSSSGAYAEVFTLTAKRLRLIQEIDWDTHFDAGPAGTHSFDANTNTFVIRSAHYIPGDAHCCVSAMDAVSFRWDGTRFVETGLNTELSHYGKTEGTQLPRIVTH